MGRPLTEIDADQVYKLARLGCTNDEIGDFFGVTGETIRTRFLDDLAVARADQKISLRRRQWMLAKNSVPMAIHLGKVYLGQSDKIDVTSKGESLETRVIVLPDNGRDTPITAD